MKTTGLNNGINCSYIGSKTALPHDKERAAKHSKNSKSKEQHQNNQFDKPGW